MRARIHSVCIQTLLPLHDQSSFSLMTRPWPCAQFSRLSCWYRTGNHIRSIHSFMTSGPTVFQSQVVKEWQRVAPADCGRTDKDANDSDWKDPVAHSIQTERLDTAGGSSCLTTTDGVTPAHGSHRIAHKGRVSTAILHNQQIQQRCDALPL